MWGSSAAAWAICLACVQPVVFPWILPFGSNRDRPSPGPEVSTGPQSCFSVTVECFSDYMTLWIPRSHVEGLRQWLSRILHLPGAWRAPDRLDYFLARCGFFLHQDPDGDFIFQAQYSACFVQKEKANYRLEIRIFQRGVTRLEQSDRYIMKCPVLMLRLDYKTIHCTSTFIQVSRPLPPGIHGRQSPWLLSLRGELVASLEDASLMGLYVDINVTTVTVQSPRQDLQKREVLNTSADLLSLWLVSGHYAYSLEAACPLVSSQPESEVLVHIPKQRLGLVKRGSRIEESLNLKFALVHQSNTFTVTENRDFVMVSIPAAEVLQVQRCQEGQGVPGMRAFYRVDLSLEFVEMATPALWTVESFFQCVGSGAELPASTAIPRTSLSSQPPGPETPPAGRPSLASSQFQAAGPAAWDGLSWADLVSHVFSPSTAFLLKEHGPLLQTAKPMGRSWTPATSLFPRAMQHQRGPQPPREVGFPGHLPLSAVLPLESIGGVHAGPRPPRPVSPGPPGLSEHLSSEISPRLPPWRPEHSKVVLFSGPSVTLAEGLETVTPALDSSQSPESPLLSRGLSGGEVTATEPIQGESIQASEEMWPLPRPSRASLVMETLLSHHDPRKPQEMSFVMEVEGPPRKGPGLPGERARGHLYLSPSEPSTGTEGLGLPILLGTEPTFTTPRVRQPDPSAQGGALGPEPTGAPEASSSGGWDRAQSLGSASSSLAGQDELGASHMSSPPSVWTPSLQAATETSWPSLAEPRHSYLVGQGVLPQQNPTEPALASSPESHRPPESQSSMEGLSERPPCQASSSVETLGAAGTLLAGVAPVTPDDPVSSGSLAQKPRCGRV
ncbi:uncharacterized protein C1orf127 homolog [Nycticebus coucang]|uniref:uncharacterized protein C1orf127 homolog n=1 Tax=Nycticebus coucang TaxID=9470 RepID=UPI00234D58DA|nr:uncharacterized protein C1orf127 homolog [Nycticebus coucang]